VVGKKGRWTDTMILKMAIQVFALNLKIVLKIYQRNAKKLPFLEAEWESFQNTYSAIPLADTDVLKL
jgi:hypothetical protein